MSDVGSLPMTPKYNVGDVVKVNFGPVTSSPESWCNRIHGQKGIVTKCEVIGVYVYYNVLLSDGEFMCATEHNLDTVSIYTAGSPNDA